MPVWCEPPIPKSERERLSPRGIIRLAVDYRQTLALMGVLLLGAGLRAGLIAAPDTGHDADQQLFVVWSRNLVQVGLGAFYSITSFCNYPPLMLLVLWALGECVSPIDGVLGNDFAMRMVLKTPACLADLLIAILLYRHCHRELSPKLGLAAAALYFLNPVPLYVSAYWGQVDSIHTLLLLAALMLIRRESWVLTGAFSALAVLQKFQSVSLLPLILFEVYRLSRWRGTARWAIGAAGAAALVCSPFFFAGVLETALRRGYVDVVGQYNDVSRNAFNFWYLVAVPSTADTSVPPVIAEIVARGRTEFRVDESWLTFFTWRHTSLVLYSLSVAIILALYSLRPGLLARYAAAGALGLAFFMIPTEMHERYALPVVAVAAPWAVSGAWRERIYVLVSVFLALNLAAVIPAVEFAGAIAVMMSIGFLSMLAWLAVGALAPAGSNKPTVPCAVAAQEASQESLSEPGGGDVRRSKLIAAFRWLTAIAAGVVLALAVWVATAWALAPQVAVEPNVLYVSSLKPVAVSQGWGKPRPDRSVSGAIMRLGEWFHLRGLGGHAPGAVEYRLPPGYDEFFAVVGVDHATGGRGSVVVVVEVDGQVRFESDVLYGSGSPVEVRVPISGASRLVLRAEPTRDGTHFDHVDWAQARLVRTRR